MATVLAAGIVSLLTLTAGIGAVATAPQAPADVPRFEVASIKRNTSGDGRVMIGMQPGGRFTATNVPLRFLMTSAFRIQEFQIDGAPGWAATDRFDIVAKAEAGAPEGQMMAMLQSLLVERFKLAAHHETKEMPIYALVLARADGRLGPKLKPSTVDCEAMRGRGPAQAGAVGAGSPEAGRAGVVRMPVSGSMPCAVRMGPGTLVGTPMSLDQLARTLSNTVRRFIVNKTGLTGNYDVDLTFTPEQLAQGGGAAGPGGPQGPAIDPNGPSVYTALQEQLGLKLDAQRGPVETLVIDHVELPTED